MSAPSRRTLPERAGQMPSKARARLDFPDALGPTIPKISPASRFRLTPLTAGNCDPGGNTTTCSTPSLPSGAGRLMVSRSSGIAKSNSPSRAYWALATAKPFHVPTNKSIGASARPNSKEPAITIPGEISPRRASNAPMPSSSDCTIMRKDFDTLPMIAALLLASVCNTRT